MAEQKQEDAQNCLSPKVILGTMLFGGQFDQKAAEKVTEEFLNRKYNELDTAFVYHGTSHSETVIGEMQQKLLISNTALISTKVHPKCGGLSSKGIMDQFNTSLQRLKMESVDILYLHQPDSNIPILDTLFVINTLYKESKFKRFGLSNYASWQITEIYYLCDKYNLIKPTVYQGLYNAISRDIELELIPCLKRFNIAFYAYNILAGGLLCDKHKYQQIESNTISKGRFEKKMYIQRYWHQSLFDGIEIIKDALKKVYGDKYIEKQSIIDASLRWIRFHSILNKEMIDGNINGVIIGAATYKHFVDNLNSLENNQPLHGDVIKAFDKAWIMAKKQTPSYIGNHVDAFYTLSIGDESKNINGVINAIDNALQFLAQN